MAAVLILLSTCLVDAARPNVLLILADDLGWSDLGCYGADYHETPNLDRLASQGTRFSQAYTASVCSPTRASIMTGKHPARLHITIWFEGSLRPVTDRKLIPPQTVSHLPLQEVTLAERLQSAGYRTIHVGKWHLGDAGHYPETQGFDVQVGGTFWGAPASYFFPYRGPNQNTAEHRYVPGLGFGKPGDHLCDRLTDTAIQFMDQVKEEPFFLNLWYHDPHTPIEAKPDLVKRYEDKKREGLNHQNPKYAAMVENLDENIGRILQYLEKIGLAERTVVVFLSDNGGYTNEFRGTVVTNNSPLRSGKGSLYEGGIRVPLLVRWPGVTKPGSVCQTPVTSMDLCSTLAEIAGVPLQEAEIRERDCLSMTGLLRNPDSKLSRDDLYFHYPHYYFNTSPVSAIRSGDWKLLEYHEDKHVELYDLGTDLGESTDRAKNLPEKAAELRWKLHAWRKAVDAQMPTANPDFERASRR
ncbi:MAG: sulfatase [Planctomycetota bacterium]